MSEFNHINESDTTSRGEVKTKHYVQVKNRYNNIEARTNTIHKLDKTLRLEEP